MKTVIIFALILTGANTASINSTSVEIVPNGRITRGQDTSVDKFPYQVAFQFFTTFPSIHFEICGGSIISKEWILTAAHCTDNAVIAIAYLGALSFTESQTVYQITPANFFVHPAWATGINPRTFDDIALIKIPQTEFSKRIQPVKLPSLTSSNTNYVGQNAVLTGWGQLQDKTYAKVLQEATFEVISNSQCGESYPDFTIPTNIICVATANGVSGNYGDSGGPLVLPSTNEQIGIYMACSAHGCQSGYPNVYTRISSYLTWIKDRTGVSY